MEFCRESEMREPVQRWLESLGCMVKAEVVNPWGKCDVIGCSLDGQRAMQRLHLGQRRTIGSHTRVAVLDCIPDQETGRGISLASIGDKMNGVISDEVLREEVHQLVARRFVTFTARRTYQKLNGWAPLHKKLIAVELKLSRVRQVVSQALGNREMTHESYAALPESRAISIVKGPQRNLFEEAGVGLLGISKRRCEVFIRPASSCDQIDTVSQMHCVEKFWRLHLTSNSS